MTTDQLADQLAALVAGGGTPSPAADVPAPEAAAALPPSGAVCTVVCDVCGHTYTAADKKDRCPNNNCPRH